MNNKNKTPAKRNANSKKKVDVAKAKISSKPQKTKLTLEQRLELGAQDYKDFEAKLRAYPDFEERMKEANEELDLWIQIYQMREAAGMTQINVAKKLGLSQSQVAKLESSTHGGYTVDTLRKLAEATDHHLVIRFEPNNRMHGTA